MDTIFCSCCSKRFQLPGCVKLSYLKIQGRDHRKIPLVIDVPSALNYVFNLSGTKKLCGDIGLCETCAYLVSQMFIYHTKLQDLLAGESILTKILQDNPVPTAVPVDETFSNSDSSSESGPEPECQDMTLDTCTSLSAPEIDPLSSPNKGSDALNSREVKIENDLDLDDNDPIEMDINRYLEDKMPLTSKKPKLQPKKYNKLRVIRQTSASTTSKASSSNPTLSRNSLLTKLGHYSSESKNKSNVLPVPVILKTEPVPEQLVDPIPVSHVSAVPVRSGRKQVLVTRSDFEVPEPLVDDQEKESKPERKSLTFVSSAPIQAIPGFIPSSNPHSPDVNFKFDNDSEPEIDARSVIPPIKKRPVRVPPIPKPKLNKKYSYSRKSAECVRRSREKREAMTPIIHGPCPFCGKIFRNKNKNWMKRHINFSHKHISNKSCNICGKPEKTDKHLLRHQKSHLSAEERKELRETQPTQCLCTECGKTYATEETLKDHQRTVHVDPESRRLFCQEPNCIYVCTLVGTMKRHAREVHDPTTEPRHRCKVCHKGFRVYNDCMNHEMTSCDAFSRPFACDHGNCLRRFKLKHALVPHLMEVHGVDPLEAREKIYPGLPFPDWVLKLKKRKR